MNVERYQWRGVDDPSRVETAVVRFGEDCLSAHGGSVARDYATAWHLRVGAGWVTEELAVSSFGDDWKRSLVLSRDSSGYWSIDADQLGEVDLPAPGLQDPSILLGAIDCDLGLCPLTNIMPIRRLGLLSRQVMPTPLVMAWVDVPSLRVLRSEQLYGSGSNNDGSLRSVRYTSRSRDFDAELTVDDDGMVIDYPTLARRSPEAPVLDTD